MCVPCKLYLHLYKLSSQYWDNTGWVLEPFLFHNLLFLVRLISRNKFVICTQNEALLQQYSHKYKYDKAHHSNKSQAVK